MARPKLEERPTKVNRSDRPKRVPINGYRNILTITGQEPGWHYCIVNDGTQAGGRNYIPIFQNAGYEFVTHGFEIGDRRINAASQIEGKCSIAVGNGVTGFVMRIQQEYYDEDQALLQAENDTAEEGMYRNLNSNEDGQYGKVKQRRGGDPI